MQVSLSDLLDLAIMGRNRILEAKKEGQISWLMSEEDIRKNFAKLGEKANLLLTDPIIE